MITRKKLRLFDCPVLTHKNNLKNQQTSRKLRNLSLRNIHDEINKIIKNGEYNAQGYYVNYFS